MCYLSEFFNMPQMRGSRGLTGLDLTELETRRGSYRGSLARFTNGKNRLSRIRDIKMSFSRITKISK